MLNSQVSGVAIQLRLRYSQSLKPCKLQKPIPNHQSSFCWIYLPLLTLNHQILLSTLSSLDITGIPLHWFESYLTGRSFRVAWGEEVSKAHQLVTGVPQGSVLGPLLFSTYTTSLDPIIQAHGFSYHFYADDTQLYLSFRPDDPMVAARISGCLADISAWMKKHHLQLNLAKTELLVLPATQTLQHDFTIQLGSSTITPSTSVRNLGVVFDDQLTFKEHIATTARSCRFALHNIRKIRHLCMLHNFSSRPLSFLDWTTTMLFWLDFHQTQSNLYKWFRMQRHEWSSTSTCHTSLYLPALVPSCSSHRSKHWCLHIEQPQAQHPPTSTHYYESTSPPEAPPTSTHYYESTSPPESPPTSTHYYESTSPPEAPPTSTHYYESTSPPEAPPTSTYYYESTSPPEAPPTSTHYYESTSPPEAPPTSTHYYESTSPPEAPPTSTHYYESTSPPEAPPTSTHYYESTSPPEAPPTSTYYYESTSPPEAPPTSTHYYESTSPPEAPPTSTHYYESTSPLEAPPTSTHYYESTSPPEAPPTSTHFHEFTSPPEVWDLLVSDASLYYHREAQNHSPEHSRSPFLAAGMIFPPPPSWTLDPCQSSSNNWKLISFNSTWLHPKKKKKIVSFSPSLASLYIFEQCLRLGVTSTSSVCLALQDESLYVFPNCKSLWIKASAKWLNVNVAHWQCSCIW